MNVLATLCNIASVQYVRQDITTSAPLHTCKSHASSLQRVHWNVEKVTEFGFFIGTTLSLHGWWRKLHETPLLSSAYAEIAQWMSA